MPRFDHIKKVTAEVRTEKYGPSLWLRVHVLYRPGEVSAVVCGAVRLRRLMARVAHRACCSYFKLLCLQTALLRYR